MTRLARSDRRRHRKAPPVRAGVEGILLRIGIAVLRALPESAAAELAARCGRLLARIDLRYRERAMANLRLIYPQWSEARRQQLLLATFAEQGRTAAEWARLSTHTPEQLSARVDWHGTEHFEKAMARGKGALVVTAHYGSWELIPGAVRGRFPHLEITVTARTLPNRHVQAIVEERRNLGGGETLPLDAKLILRALRRNAAIGVLVDQRRKRERGGILVPFLGKRTWTNAGPATLALRTGAAVLPVHCERTAGGRQRITFGPELEMPQTGDRKADIWEGTRRINAWVEELIRARPELWLWAHRRWHRSPDTGRIYRRRKKRR